MLANLIQAFAILIKYGDANVQVDSMGNIIVPISPSEVSRADRDALSRLGFDPDIDDEHFWFCPDAAY